MDERRRAEVGTPVIETRAYASQRQKGVNSHGSRSDRLSCPGGHLWRNRRVVGPLLGHHAHHIRAGGCADGCSQPGRSQRGGAADGNDAGAPAVCRRVDPELPPGARRRRAAGPAAAGCSALDRHLGRSHSLCVVPRRGTGVCPAAGGHSSADRCCPGPAHL